MTGHIRRRGKKTWAIILDIGEDAAGKRRQKWHSFKGTKKEAEAEKAKLLNEVNTGMYVEPARLTVGQYLEKWLDSSAKINVSGKTFERYAEIVRRHLVPELGLIALAKLTPLRIQDAYAKDLRSGRLNHNKGTGLSARTVLHHHRVLHKALEQAVKWQLLARNPADAVEAPKPERKEMKAIDGNQMASLLEATLGTKFYIPVLLSITTGMRRGEFLALRWADVNMVARMASVRRSVEQTKGSIRYKPPKGKQGRHIDLPDITVEALKVHRVAQDGIKKLFGADYTELDLICASEDGTQWNPDSFTSQFKKLARRQGLKGVRLHDMRHSHATQLLQQGVHPKIVSERLGHSSVAITLDTYSHVLPGMQESAAQKVDAVLRAAIVKERARKPS